MSIVGAIRNFKVTLAQAAPIATARNACRRFNSWFSNFMSKPLQSRSAQVGVARSLKGRPETVLRTRHYRAQGIPKHAKKSETPSQIKINQNGSVVEFIDSLVRHVEQKLHPDLRKSDTQFTFGVSEAFLDTDLTLDKRRRFIEEAEGMEFKGRRKIVIEVIRDTPPEKLAELFLVPGVV
jgi:hypothetical protein